MNFCIAGRCDGASSTSTASSGIAADERVQQEFDRDRIGRRRRRRQHAALRRRAFGLGQQIEQHRQRRLHGRDDAGAERRYRGRGRIVGDLEDRGRAIEDRGVAFDMKGKHRRADHDHQIMLAQARPRAAPARHAGSPQIADAVPENCNAPKTG